MVSPSLGAASSTDSGSGVSRINAMCRTNN